MTENRSFRLRVKYAQRGRLCYLSHLETCRALEHMVRRAGLPFAITQGFNPHMKIAFGSALPVGIGGTEEIFDLVLTDYLKPETIMMMLEKASVPDLKAYECWYLEKNAKAASVAYPYSEYEVVFFQKLNTYSIPNTIEVIKKKTRKTLNVVDYLLEKPNLSNDGLVFRFALQSKETGSLRADDFVRESCGDALIKSFLRLKQGSERG